MIDLGLLGFVVSFLMGFGVVYGFLMKSRLLGDDNSTMLFISLAMGLMIAVSWSARTAITMIINISIVFFLFAFVGFLVVQWLGLDISIVKNIISSPIVLVAFILIASTFVLIMESKGTQQIINALENKTNISVNSTVESPNDLTDLSKVFLQPQIWGSLLILGVMAAISYGIVRR